MPERQSGFGEVPTAGTVPPPPETAHLTARCPARWRPYREILFSVSKTAHSTLRVPAWRPRAPSRQRGATASPWVLGELGMARDRTTAVDGTGRRVNSPQSFPWMWGEPQHLAKHPLKSQRATVPAKRTAPTVPPLRCPLVPAPQTTHPGLPPPVCRAESRSPSPCKGWLPGGANSTTNGIFFPQTLSPRPWAARWAWHPRCLQQGFLGTPLSNPTAPAAPSPTASSVWP